LTVCLGAVSILGVYHLTFFFQQLLFLQVLDYLIKKIEKLTMGNFIKYSRWAMWFLLVILFGYLGSSLVKRLPNINKFCPGALETHNLPMKIILLTTMMTLFIMGVFLLIKLLAVQHNSLFDSTALQQRDAELRKLKFVMFVVVLAEGLQLAISIFHLTYDDPTEACSPVTLKDSPFLESVITSTYRLLGFYLPIMALLWLVWARKEKDRTFSRRFSEDDTGHHMRYASTTLSFSTRSPTKYNLSESFIQQHRRTGIFQNSQF